MTDEADRYLGEKDLVHHPQGRRAMTAADLAAMHTRHANALPIPSGTVLGHEHLMPHPDRVTLLAELNRQMERVFDLEAQVERLNLEVVQNASGAQVIMDAGVACLQEVKRLEKVNAQLKEATARPLSDLESVTAERDMWRQRMRVKALEKANAEATVERLRAVVESARKALFEDAALSDNHRLTRLTNILGTDME